jgi:hypothetical protein
LLNIPNCCLFACFAPPTAHRLCIFSAWTVVFPLLALFFGRNQTIDILETIAWRQLLGLERAPNTHSPNQRSHHFVGDEIFEARVIGDSS